MDFSLVAVSKGWGVVGAAIATTLVAVCGLPVVVASLVMEHGL